jgi:integrase
MARFLCSTERWTAKSFTRVALQLATEIATMWKKKGTNLRLAPTTLSGYVSAISTACQMAGEEMRDNVDWKGIVRGINKRKATHIRRQAFPLTRRLWRRIVASPSVSTLHRQAIIMCWTLALRVGDLQHLKPSSVRIMMDKKTGEEVAEFDMSGIKGHDLGNAAHFKYVSLTGPAAQLRRLVRTKSKLPREAQPPLIKVSTNAIRRTLKRFDGRLGSHSIRRGIATFLTNKGKPMRVVQEVLAHKSITSTRMYVATSLQQKAVQRAVRLSRLMF